MRVKRDEKKDESDRKKKGFFKTWAAKKKEKTGRKKKIRINEPNSLTKRGTSLRKEKVK